MNEGGLKATLALIVILVVLVGGPLVANVVIPESRAVQALSDAGYTNIHLTGSDVILVGIRGCDSGDSKIFYADATNPIGKPVSGLTVCSGFLKGATIRTR